MDDRGLSLLVDEDTTTRVPAVNEQTVRAKTAASCSESAVR